MPEAASASDPTRVELPWDPTGVELAVALVARETGAPLDPAPRSARRPLRPSAATGEDSTAWSGAGADGRDPQGIDGAMSDLLRSRGWQQDVALHALTGRWAEVVGSDIAAHTTPRVDNGVLVITCSSSAWAFQLQAMLPTVRRRMAEWAGSAPGSAHVPDEIRVVGPQQPSWRHGRRVVRGRGPRDTYG